jgi:uncharacterized protein YbgA (DUF1722 family)
MLQENIFIFHDLLGANTNTIDGAEFIYFHSIWDISLLAHQSRRLRVSY